MPTRTLLHRLRLIDAGLLVPAILAVIWGELSHAWLPAYLGQHIWDKALHFTAYFGLSLMAAIAVRTRRRALWSALGLVIMGGLLEIVQGYTGRDCDIRDEVANTLGVTAGLLLATLGIAILRRSHMIGGEPVCGSTTLKKGRASTMFKEFRTFIMRGNVVDLAVGVVIGASFTGIVSSLVKDVLMPPIGLVLGGIDFSNFFLVLKGSGHYASVKAAADAGAVTLNYGLFINAILNFLIVAFVLFLLLRQINKLKAPTPNSPPAETPEDIQLLREIRDSLKART